MAVYPACSRSDSSPVNARATRPLRVLLADDHRLFAEGLALLLGADDRIDVVGHAQNGLEAIDLVAKLEPDVVLMDISMPAMDGIEATRAIRADHPSTCVLVLTGSTSSDGVRRAGEAGAAGYLSKDSLASDLVGAIFEVAALATLGRPDAGVTAPALS
jgi:DNA-binding NarL/FixJ family response regulator